MKKQDLIWTTGFFEGEGTIRITNPGKHHLGYLEVSLVNTDKEIIEWFKKYFGSGYIKTVKGRGNRKTAWRWIIASNQAFDFLMKIKSFAKRDVIKERIRVGIYYQKKKQNHCKFKNGKASSEEYRHELFDAMIYMAALNQRGNDHCPKADEFRKAGDKK